MGPRLPFNQSGGCFVVLAFLSGNSWPKANKYIHIYIYIYIYIYASFGVPLGFPFTTTMGVCFEAKGTAYQVCIYSVSKGAPKPMRVQKQSQKWHLSRFLASWLRLSVCLWDPDALYTLQLGFFHPYFAGEKATCFNWLQNGDLLSYPVVLGSGGVHLTHCK